MKIQIEFVKTKNYSFLGSLCPPINERRLNQPPSSEMDWFWLRRRRIIPLFRSNWAALSAAKISTSRRKPKHNSPTKTKEEESQVFFFKKKMGISSVNEKSKIRKKIFLWKIIGSKMSRENRKTVTQSLTVDIFAMILFVRFFSIWINFFPRKRFEQIF